jgi:hypothetical protein
MISISALRKAMYRLSYIPGLLVLCKKKTFGILWATEKNSSVVSECVFIQPYSPGTGLGASKEIQAINHALIIDVHEGGPSYHFQTGAMIAPPTCASIGPA